MSFNIKAVTQGVMTIMLTIYNAEGGSKRGLASADRETRRRVAAAGGRASHNGGRKRKEG